MKNATFRQLRVFNEVARHLSFVRAAETLHLTPPAVTMQIKELEGHVGMPLFERRGKQVSLTTTGEYMLVYTRKILATIKDAEDAAARLQRVETGVLTIGFVSTAKYFLMRMLADFRSKHPGVEVQLSIGNRDQLVKMLQNSEVDIAVMGRPPKELQTRAEPFAAHPHVFVAATDHPLTKRGPLTVEDLRPYDFIARENGAGTRAAMEKFFEETHVEPRLKIELHSNEIIKQAVMAGLGLGFLSMHTIGLELEHQLIAMLDVQGAPVVRAWNVVHTQSKMLSPAAEAFRYFMLENGERHLAEQFGHHLRI
ncbi:MAG: HTH-type transcriptional activator CmpR [Pseudomonadota bacterium]|jgi:DNA-binding transcriptional LysR family regulator